MTRVLPAVGIYGPNASGKSNVLAALVELADRATWLPRREQEPRPDPFLLDSTSREAPTLFEVEFLLAGVRYGYGLEQDDGGVVREWLHAFPLGRRQVWFERDASAAEPFRFPGDYLRGAKSLLSDLVRPEAPFLSLGMSLRHPQLSPVAQWLRGIRRPRPGPTRLPMLRMPLRRLFEGRYAGLATALIRRADLGIVGAELVDTESFEGSTSGIIPRREVYFRHLGADGDALLPLSAESEGTLSWAHLLQVLLPVLSLGGVLVVDELDASLHPELAAEVIRMFQDPAVNTHRAQLLFASHDVTMLGAQFGSPLLDRDQIWFTEKDQTGTTELYSLAELKPRKGENVERGYLAGRYGATPGLSPGELGRVLLQARRDEAPA
ncbi:MAG TPA: ATP-binding protein [Mycobacteriales bacterium]|nr:ATP-binding protein [Mycobacteriales bacterium]